MCGSAIEAMQEGDSTASRCCLEMLIHWTSLCFASMSVALTGKFVQNVRLVAFFELQTALFSKNSGFLILIAPMRPLHNAASSV